MKILSNIKPKFWDYNKQASTQPRRFRFNFRKMWKLTFISTIAVSLIPLIVMAVIDFRVGKEAIESEILLRASRLVSNTRRSVAYFLDERKAALNYVIQNESFNELLSIGYIGKVLGDLKNSFGGFIDLGIIDDRGLQVSYSGPYNLFGKNYKNTNWFREVEAKGVYVSDVFMGFRNIPHMVIAMKHNLKNGRFYVLRATLDTAKFNDLLSGLDMGGDGDAFVINGEGRLQTPSKNHGKTLDKIKLSVPAYSERTRVEEVSSATGDRLIIGYAYIQTTPFILMIVKNKELLMTPWNQSRMKILGFLLVSIIIIVVVLLGGISYLVNQIYLTDQRRLMALSKAEYSNKMASLGRLSAGIAHEINNPLAIIREKAGLVKDIFTFTDKYSGDEKLMKLTDIIISSVDRCADITWRLLGFVRRSDMKIKEIDLKAIVKEVLSFLEKEAMYRSIDVKIDIPEVVPRIITDYGRLQEIFLNLITNAFAAVKDGGSLEIGAQILKPGWIEIWFSDNGHGIPENDLEHIFEPFFSTKTGNGGSGLGLSITYRLVEELGGLIKVKSKVGSGTVFKIDLPMKTEIPKIEEVKDGTDRENSVSIDSGS